MQSREWTARLAGLAEERKSHPKRIFSDTSKLELGCKSQEDGVDIAIRLEGPYFSPADPTRYDTVVCLVAGTGISGAIAITSAFNASVLEEQESRNAVSAVGTTFPWRRCIIVWSLKESDDVELPFLQATTEGLEVRKFLTGSGRKRVNLGKEMRDITEQGGRTWVYISGPSTFMDAGKLACQGLANVDCYAASWDI